VTAAAAVRDTARGLLADEELADLRRELVELGFGELVAEDPREAIALWFTEQGRAGRITGALDLLVDDAGADPVLYPLCADRGVVLDPPPTLTRVHVPGVGRAEVGQVRPAGGFAHELHVALVEPRADLPDLAEPLLSRLRTALAWELIGAAERIAELTVEYVGLREQFGSPIGTRQAVRHRLADVRVALEGARVVAARTPLDDSVLAAAAKALAGRAALLACDWALQFHGAIGFTREHRLPHHVRQVRFLDGLLGSAATLTTQLGTRIAAEPAVTGAVRDVLGPAAEALP